MTHPIVDQLLVPFTIRFFFVFGLIGLAVGIGLVVNRARMHEFFGVMNHWVSLRRSTKWLAIPRETGAGVLRHRRLIGAVIVIAAAFSGYVLATQLDDSRIMIALGIHHPAAVVAWGVQCARWLLIAGSVFAIAVGILLMFFPALLHAVETHANRWYSLRSHTHGGDVMHLGFDRWVERHPTALGWIIAAGALVVTIDNGILLFAGD